jgi:hypothetical protein
MDYNKKIKTGAQIETAEMKFLKGVAGYTRKEQMRNAKFRESLNIFNLNAKIIKSRPQWKYHVQGMEDRRIANKMLTYKTKQTALTVNMKGSAHSSRGRNRPHMS